MTATILPEIVQLPFGLGNLMSGEWLAIEGLSGQTTTEDIENVCAKRCVFIDRPRQRGSDRCGGNADGSAAVDSVRGLRVVGEGRDRFDRDQ
jgi:hypothetical protein